MVQYLRFAAKASGADLAPRRQITQMQSLPANQHVARILPFGYGRYYQSARQFRRQILHRVDCEIDVVSQQGVFDFLGEHTLASKDLQGSFDKAVAARLDNRNFDARVRVPFFDSLPHPV
jgi:hypothetical protein